MTALPFGVLLLRDHFSAGPFGQQLAPFTGLAAAAAATTRLRLGNLEISVIATFVVTGKPPGRHRGAHRQARLDRGRYRAGLADAGGLPARRSSWLPSSSRV